MSGMIQRAVAALSFVLLCLTVPAQAQETVRVRGTIERIEGPVYVVKNRDGAELKLTVTDNPLFVAIVPATMADIKPGMFVGSAGMMEADGTQKAIEVHIFPESMRGTGEGHYDWDLMPKSKMTNGNVEQAVTGVDGPVLSVKYKDGEKKLVVTPQTVVVTYVMGDKAEIKPGTKIFVAAAKKQAHHVRPKRRRACVLTEPLPARTAARSLHCSYGKFAVARNDSLPRWFQ
jgi:hypothetical protein